MKKTTKELVDLSLPQIGSVELASHLSWLAKKTPTITPFIVGQTGTGKSEIVRQMGAHYHQENKAKNRMFSQPPPEAASIPSPLMTSPGVFELRCDLLSEPADFLGIPEVHEVRAGHGGMVRVTGHAQPEWIPLWDRYHYFIFLDELNRAPQDILNGVMQLILDRRMHTHRIPEGVFFVAAGNPSDGNYNVNELDEALTNRMLFLSYKADPKDFLEYAAEKGFDPRVMDYINEHRDQLSEAGDAPSLRMNPSPRKWEVVSTVMGNWDKRDPYCALSNLKVLCSGLVGEAIGASFAKYYYEEGMAAVGAEEIFEVPPHAFPEERLKAQRNHAERTFYTSIMSDVWWKNKDPDSIRPEEVKALDRFVTLLSKEKVYSFLHSMTGPEHRKGAGFKALSMCHKSKEIIRNVIEERSEYAAL